MTATVTDLDILRDLDFDPEHDCEHYNHGKVWWHTGPAKYVVAVRADCPECKSTTRDTELAPCKAGWDHAAIAGLQCCNERCSHKFKRHEVWSIVAVL